MDIRERIISLAKQCGWNQEKLAKESRLTTITISYIYQGKIVPSFVTLQMICNAFGLTLSQFFYDDIEISYSEEQNILKRWNRLSGEQKKNLMEVMDKMVAVSKL